MAKWIPDRKVWATGIAGVLAWVVIAALGRWGGFKADPGTHETLAALIGWGIGYLVPPSQKDIIKRLDDTIVAIAAADPKVPVDPTTAPRR